MEMPLERVAVLMGDTNYPPTAPSSLSEGLHSPRCQRGFGLGQTRQHSLHPRPAIGRTRPRSGCLAGFVEVTERGKLGGYLPQRPLPTLGARTAKLLGERDGFRSQLGIRAPTAALLAVVAILRVARGFELGDAPSHTRRTSRQSSASYCAKDVALAFPNEPNAR
jgi:hypothetical protein